MAVTPKHPTPDSSNVIGFEYFPKARVLAVWFRGSQHIYMYQGFPSDRYTDMLDVMAAGGSIGTLIARGIRKLYQQTHGYDENILQLRAAEETDSRSAIAEAVADDRERGAYQKFNVSRSDGSSNPGGKHERCENFVLDLHHDKHAVAALIAYADAVEADGYALLAADLRQTIARFQAHHAQ